MRVPRLAAVLLGAVALGGCGQDSTPEAKPPTPPQAPAPPQPSTPPAASPAPAGPPSVADVEFGEGWQPEERNAAGAAFRWMGTRARLTVRTSGAFRLEFAAASLAKPRTLTVRLANRVIARAELPRVGGRRVRVDLPAGTGAATLDFEAQPGASPASVVSPSDKRRLAVLVSELTVSPAADG